jgi:queuine/archaeosine tRNA-ribosyltransferase
MILNAYVLSIGVPKFIKQTVMNIKEQIGSDIIIAEDLNTLLSSVNRIFIQKS